MKLTKKIATSLLLCLVTTGTAPIVLAADPGNAQAALSGSTAYRNIIGFEMSEIPPAQQALAGCEGVYVSAVIAGHPASVGGLKTGDIITRIGNFAVPNKPDALEVINSLEAGLSYPFEICRLINGQVQKITLNILVEKVQERAIGKIS
jgi:S1-C subfamily serine protease